MVDINNLYDGNFDYGIPSLLSLTPCQVNEYLKKFDIDNDDILNSFNDCSPSSLSGYNADDSPLSNSHFVIETPPETPVNYPNPLSNNNNNNGLNQDCQIISNALFSSPSNGTENLIDFNTNLNNNNPTTTNYHCLQAQNINCLPSPASSTTDSSLLNGFNNLDRSISENNIKVFDIHHVPKNNIRPKIILPNKTTNTKLNNNNSNNNGIEKELLLLKKSKLEARKLRNREAALNSRLKKKEYLENLESKVSSLNKENNELLLENALLKQKIADLEQELDKFRNSVDINGNWNQESSKKKTISLFAVAFVFFFQIFPYLPSLSSSSLPSNPLATKTNRHLSRTLLWNTKEDYFQYPKDFNSSTAGLFRTKRCDDTYYNRTELIRLENELRGWLTRFKLEENESKRRFDLYRSKHQNTKKLLYDLKHVPIPRLKLWMQKQRYIDYINDELESQNNLDLFYPFDYENLMSTIHRRDDTFYYLSYPSKGHLILPPMSNRSDIRPRFSFLIPTFYNFSLNNTVTSSNKNLNETTGLAARLPQLYMLQIDCQVINTKVTMVNVDSHHHNRFNKNSTSSSPSSSLNRKPSNRLNKNRNNSR